jgi:hypothetical protein
MNIFWFSAVLQNFKCKVDTEALNVSKLNKDSKTRELAFKPLKRHWGFDSTIITSWNNLPEIVVTATTFENSLILILLFITNYILMLMC